MTSVDTESHLRIRVCAWGRKLISLQGRLSAKVLICEFSPDLWLCLWTFLFFFFLHHPLLLLSASTVSTPRPSAGRLKRKQSQGNKREKVSIGFSLSLVYEAACGFKQTFGATTSSNKNVSFSFRQNTVWKMFILFDLWSENLKSLECRREQQ